MNLALNPDGTPVNRPLLQSFRNTTTAQVASSNAWYATFGFFEHQDQTQHSLAQELTWSHSLQEPC